MTVAHYTIIDLGSNSFHMLTVTKQAGSFNVVSKHKQRVRLAAGLDAQNKLDLSTMQKGWDCLQDFRLKLDNIQPVCLLITATAALRMATNSEQFLATAEKILRHPVNLITGIQEAETIFKGVAFTEKIDKPLLVIDIGGASTELVLGAGQHTRVVNSLNIGCVTWLQRYFTDQQLNESNFKAAINAAKQIIATIATPYIDHGWQLTLGASGTIQAIAEVSQAQQLNECLTLDLLNEIKHQCIQCRSIEQLNIKGLKVARTPVFASGLAILIALFECLNIHSMRISKGALREGLISMMFNVENNFNTKNRF